MKQRILCIMASLLPLLTFSQGIQWTTGLSWEQVKEKAKKENKYIFVDCYATWCVPCKKMDQDIYPLQQVGELYNEKFISIKVQDDQKKNDPEHVKNWYEYARKLNEHYKVKAFPTFLFFTPDGELVHRASGGFNAEKFIVLANDALNNRGLYVLLKAFQKGDFEYVKLKELALACKYAGEDSMAKAIAFTYVKPLDFEKLSAQDNLSFLSRISGEDKKWVKDIFTPKVSQLSIGQLANPQSIRLLLLAVKNDSLAAKATDYWITHMTNREIFSKDTLELIKSFMRHSYDKSFVLLYKNEHHVNKVMGKKNWASAALASVILNEEYYTPIYYPAVNAIEHGTEGKTLSEPDWKKLTNTIKQKYGIKYASWVQFSTKFSWHALVGNKKEYVKYLVAEMDRTKGFGFNILALNNTSMEVFQYSTSRRDLLKAAGWMKRYYKKNPKEFNSDALGLDTYAILLYKAGKIKKSMELEERAAKISPDNSEIADNLAKMKKGLPIWPEGFDVVK